MVGNLNSKTRHAQIAMEMGRRYDEPELVAIKNQVKNWTPQQLCEHYESLRPKTAKKFGNSTSSPTSLRTLERFTK
jgi:hypothetical protein